MLYISLDDRHESRTFSFPRDEATIGSDDQSDLVIDKPGVAARHVRAFARGGRVCIEDLRRRHPVLTLEPGEAIKIAGVVLRLALHTLEPETDEAIERRFLDALGAQPDDDATREVYADWLEQHGHAQRAEFLRMQHAARVARSPFDPDFAEASRRLTELAPLVGEGWRARVATAFVEKCPRHRTDWRQRQALGFELLCSMRWNQLTPTEHEGVRICGACDAKVTYCTTIEQARTIAAHHGCIALDLGVERDMFDLDRRHFVGRPAPALARLGRRDDR
ncbi:MAG TPA: TIGR02996 domain-containing protein [Kofleriaceae bacterium]|nr:TIGR02996 domain-containing protein [Kofleriaceae bacterium]